VWSQAPRPSPAKGASAAPKQLPEATRKQIYWEAFSIEHKAVRAANTRYPIDPSGNDFIQQVKVNGAYADKLVAKDESALHKRYGITEDQYNNIVVEGTKKNWPRPSSQP
jgi:hypothetical protein